MFISCTGAWAGQVVGQSSSSASSPDMQARAVLHPAAPSPLLLCRTFVSCSHLPSTPPVKISYPSAKASRRRRFAYGGVQTGVVGDRKAKPKQWGTDRHNLRSSERRDVIRASAFTTSSARVVPTQFSLQPPVQCAPVTLRLVWIQPRGHARLSCRTMAEWGQASHKTIFSLDAISRATIKRRELYIYLIASRGCWMRSNGIRCG